jgi:hypothetical protein
VRENLLIRLLVKCEIQFLMKLMKTSLCACLTSSEVESTKRFSLKLMFSPDCRILNHFLLSIHVVAAKSRIEIIARRRDSDKKEYITIISCHGYGFG